jgi:L-cysteate sulfo-lyase
MNTEILSKKINLAFLPTPIRYAENLTKVLKGPKIYIKRDDMTGIAFGGNKVRKLEYLLFDALDKKCDSVITVGGMQSNHALQTATMARMLGLEPYLILEGEKPETYDGNLFLNALLKANISFYFSEATLDLNKPLKELEKTLLEQGKKPYPIPLGGSSSIGSMGYVNAMQEIIKQSNDSGVHFDYIAVAATSCGTYTGLVLGKELFNYHTNIVGYNVGLPRTIIDECVNDLLTEGSKTLGIPKPRLINDLISDEYIGEGYAIPSIGCKEAIKLISRTEGIFLDPVYSGKAMAGLIDFIRKGTITSDKNVLYIHTGGGPSIFSFKEALLEQI